MTELCFFFLSLLEMLILLLTWPQMLPTFFHPWHPSEVFSLFNWLWMSAWSIFLEVFKDSICCMCIWNTSVFIAHSLSPDQFECYWDIIMNFSYFISYHYSRSMNLFWVWFIIINLMKTFHVHEAVTEMSTSVLFQYKSR